MITRSWAQPCVECGQLTYSVRWYRDDSPTDQGDEVRQGYEAYCGCDGDYGEKSEETKP